MKEISIIVLRGSLEVILFLTRASYGFHSSETNITRYNANLICHTSNKLPHPVCGYLY